jgi:RNA polymerase sigma factor (sigma-70 family)
MRGQKALVTASVDRYPKLKDFRKGYGMNSYFSTVADELDILESADDEMLVTAAKGGDHSAFSELWNRHSKRAFNTMFRITKNRQDAEDGLQDAFMKAFVHLSSFDGRSAFSTWLTRIAINSALMTLRRKRAHPETSMEWSTDGNTWRQWEVADTRANVEEHYEKSEAEWLLGRAIGRLQPTLRNVIEIQRSHCISVREIAEVAGISVAATKSRLLRARTVLRRSLVLHRNRSQRLNEVVISIPQSRESND